MTIGISLLFGTLYGCNDKEDIKDVAKDAPVEQQSGNTNNTEQGATNAPYNFTHFDLDVDYSPTESYEVDYENELEGAEAKLEDDLNNHKHHGDEAYGILQPLFERLSFDATTPNDEVIKEVISVFSLNEDYTNFELEVEFADGTKKEYRDTK